MIGYAAFRNKDRTWLFGKLLWELDHYAYFAVRVKSDGRRYTVNVQTDSIIETDIHQHRLYTHHHRLPRSSSDIDAEFAESDIPAGLRDLPPPSTAPGPTLSYTSTPNPEATGWETIYIPWQQFVRTNNGYAVAPQTGPMMNKIKSVGIGLTDRVEGPYDLRIHRMWASNGLSPEEVEEEKRICGFVTVPTETDEDSDVPIAKQEEEQLHRFKNLKAQRKKDDK
jgi:NADH dehydrogenase [ubiquinone] 1 alpha subcomplex assembly factor 1